MNAQDVILGSRVAHLRELKTEISRLKSENDALRTENEELKNHFDLAVLAAEDLRRLGPEGRLVLVDGWNLVLGAERRARDPEELVAKAKSHLAENPDDFVWIVFDGPRFDVRNEARLRLSWTGGTGPQRADRFICDFLRMARFSGDLGRIEVRTGDKILLHEIDNIRRKF